MSKFEFQKDPNRKKTKPIEATKISEPVTTFNLNDFASIERESEERTNKIGRPRKNKVYSTIRIQKNNVNRINAFQNTLDFDTQDDLIGFMLDRLDSNLESEQRTMFEMYMKTYESRDKKKN